MAIDGFKRNYKPFEILSQDQVEAIHRSTLKVLAETGVALEDEKVLKILAEHGCSVDFGSKRARLPANLVEESLDRCPESFTVKARDPENSVVLGQPDVTYFSSSAGMSTVDVETWEPRQATRQEFYDYMKVLDALPHVHVLNAFPWFGFARVPQVMSLIESNAAKFRMCSKAQHEGSVVGNDRWNIEMAKATGQDLLQLVNPAAPLALTKEVTDKVFTYTQADMPFHFASGPVAGASAPATVVGAVITNNCEAIAGMVLTQLIKPGHRVWAGSFINMQNMRQGSPACGAIENSLCETVFNQMWRRYKVPHWSSSSAWCSSKMIDFQSAYETGMAALTCALAGANCVIFQGGLTLELVAHPLKAILDDDVAGMVGRFLRGAEVSDATMAVDVINQVGPLPGHFLSTAHTREWWKKEQFMPSTCADRLTHPEWARAGKKKALDHARERMEDILASHKPLPLSSGQEKAIEDILNDARQWYRKQGMISDDEWQLYQEDLNSPNYPYA